MLCSLLTPVVAVFAAVNSRQTTQNDLGDDQDVDGLYNLGEGGGIYNLGDIVVDGEALFLGNTGGVSVQGWQTYDYCRVTG